MEQQIKKILDEKVIPLLQTHGGSCEFVGVENNVVKVRLQGACGHCPGAIMTLRGFVLKVLQEEIPSIEDVVNVQ
ncbi:NifU family protein [bacterium]|jgi:Fe-S cluster biogenesis protein NfuA|nr:NifU family protein [bacterium]